MSDTPRTDAVYDDIKSRRGSAANGNKYTRGWSLNELWDFAKQLERELSADARDTARLNWALPFLRQFNVLPLDQDGRDAIDRAIAAEKEK